MCFHFITRLLTAILCTKLLIKEVKFSIVVGINAYNFDTIVTSADID